MVDQFLAHRKGGRVRFPDVEPASGIRATVSAISLGADGGKMITSPSRAGELGDPEMMRSDLGETW